jgi:hypothetical protein
MCLIREFLFGRSYLVEVREIAQAMWMGPGEYLVGTAGSRVEPYRLLAADQTWDRAAEGFGV